MNPSVINQTLPPQRMGGPTPFPPGKQGPPVMNGSSGYNQNMNNQSIPPRPMYHQPGPGTQLNHQMQNMHLSDPKKQMSQGPQQPSMPNSSQYQNGPGQNLMQKSGPENVNMQQLPGTNLTRPPKLSPVNSSNMQNIPNQPTQSGNFPSQQNPGANIRPGPPGGLNSNISSVNGPPGMRPPSAFMSNNPSQAMNTHNPAQGPPTSSVSNRHPPQGPTSMQGPGNMIPGPPSSGPPNMMSGPPSSGPPNMMSGPPSSGPPNMMSRPPSSGPPNMMSGPPSSGPPNMMSGPPSSGPPNMMSGPPSSGPPNMMSGPPSSGPPNMMSGPPSSGPPNMMPGHSNLGPPASMQRPMPGQQPPLPNSGMGQPLSGIPSSTMNGHMPHSSLSNAPGLAPQRPMHMSGPGPVHQQSSLQNSANMPRHPGPPGGFSMANNMPMAAQQHYPQPEMQPVQNRQPGYNNMPPQQPQPSRRLDPDQMPSPIQVMEDDKKARSGMFYTNQKGQLPPLVSTDFTVQDQGNCSPRYMRSTIYNVPSNPDMLKQTAVPFAITINAFANAEEGEHPPPLVNLGEMGPVRCNRCKAYMCPYMQFIDGGRRFQCIFCKCTTEVPAEYFAHLDHTGQRGDKYERPELCLGSYEFTATLDYCKNGKTPGHPAFIFMLDVSYNSVRSGVVNLLCQNMKNLLKSLPVDDVNGKKIQVGFVTYNSVMHFYNVKACLSQPQMMVVPDVQEMFMPLLDGFLVNIDEAEAVIDSLMEQIPTMFGDTRETEIILGPVIQAGLEALKAADCAGKLFIFHSSLPIADAPGKLKNRDDRKVLGTDKEKNVLCPQDKFYNQLGQDCVAVGCCVDLFLFPNSFIDVATIGQVCRLTGGQVYKYSHFQSDVDGTRFLEDLKRDLERPIAFDAIMRIRTSTGVRPTDFFGNYFMSNTTDVELASVDCDKAICAEIKHDDKLTEEDGVYIQAATLYTSIGGQRRLRIHNLSLNCCTQMADLFRTCELDTIMNFFAKQSMRVILDQNPKNVKDNYIQRAANILASYRKNCSNPSSAGQLILPEGMKLLPLYINCLIKSDALAGGSDMTVDDKSFAMQFMNYADVDSSLGYLYPRLYSLHDGDMSEDMPKLIRTSGEKLQDNGIYLLENGIYLFLWIGQSTDPSMIQDLFGVPSISQIETDRVSQLPEFDNKLSQRVREVIENIKSERHRCMKFAVVRQRDKLDLVFRNFLVEDKSVNGGASYVDFLCHMHKEIRSLLS